MLLFLNISLHFRVGGKLDAHVLLELFDSAHSLEAQGFLFLGIQHRGGGFGDLSGLFVEAFLRLLADLLLEN